MDLSTLKTWPINPSVFYKQIYVKDWYEKRLFYSRKKANGYWENPHRCEKSYNLAKPFIKKFNRCIDIGCRDGEFTRWLESDFKHTYCFDVFRSRFFEWNVPVNKGTTTLFHCALSHEAGMKNQKHLVKDEDDRSNVRGKHTTFSEDDIRKVKNVGIPDRCFTLDSFYLGKIDFIKIDVDGGELQVFQGAKETILKNRPVILMELERPIQYEAMQYLIENYNYKQATTLDDHDQDVVLIYEEK